jgi:hypothetical protein
MKRWILLLVAALLVVSLGCSLFGGKDKEPVSEEGTTGENTTEEVEEGETGGPTFDDDALEGLDSYRSTFTMRTDMEDGTITEVAFEHEATRDPAASRVMMKNTAEGTTSEIEMIQVGETSWMRMGEEWMQTSSDQATSFEQGMPYSADSFTSVAEDKDYEFVGKEEINGVQTRHYRLSLVSRALTGLAFGNLDSGDIEVWVADESDLPKFPVRFTLEAEGELQEGKQGKLTFSQEIYDVNADFTIEPPAEAAETLLPEGVSAYPGATDTISMGSMYSFNSADDVATVAAFYQSAFEAAGWSQADVSEMEGMLTATWEKAGETSLSLIIMTRDEGGSNVVIMPAGQ